VKAVMEKILSLLSNVIKPFNEFLTHCLKDTLFTNLHNLVYFSGEAMLMHIYAS